MIVLDSNGKLTSLRVDATGRLLTDASDPSAANEAAMLALPGAVVGSTILRTDIGSAPGTLYQCIALPTNLAANWTPIANLLPGNEVDLTEGTWATRPTTGFVAGVRYYRRMTDIGDNGGVVMVRTSTMSEWGFAGEVPIVSLIGTNASPALSHTLAGATGYLAVATFPAKLLKAAKRLQFIGNIKNEGGGTVTLALVLGTLGTSSDQQIRQQATITAGNSWNVFNNIHILPSGLAFSVHSANPNLATTANYDERGTNVDVDAVMYLGIALSAGTATGVTKVLQLIVSAV